MTSNDVLSCTPNEENVTKATFRFKVWNLLENKDLVMFPRPCKGRIPNFVDCNVAAEKLTALDVFKKAEVVKVNMDKPHEAVRFSVLEEGKTLLVPILSLSEGVVMKVCPPENANRGQLSFACKRKGTTVYGKPLALDDKTNVDLIVIGSVAVSKEGYRIGKGEGFSDLEYGLMAATGLVSEDTVIVTTVHDDQVFDNLPEALFQPFDVPVDFIITPTQVIEVTPRLPKPKGILWNFVSDRRMQHIPLLKTLRSKEMEEGHECTLKEVDSEPEERIKPYYRPSFVPRRRPFVRQQRGQFNYDRNISGPRNNNYRPNYNRSYQRRPNADNNRDSPDRNNDEYNQQSGNSPDRNKTRNGQYNRPRNSSSGYYKGRNNQRKPPNNHSPRRNDSPHRNDSPSRSESPDRITSRNNQRRQSNHSPDRRNTTHNYSRGRQNRQMNSNRGYNNSHSQESQRTITPAPEAPRRTRTFRRGGNQRRPMDGSGDIEVHVNGHSQERKQKVNPRMNGENKENQHPQTRPRPFRRGPNRFFRQSRFPVDFSVRVGNIGSSMRVRDLKAALREKGVRPQDITWKGAKGFAVLHFAKNKNEEEQQPIAVDDVIASLQNLTVTCKSEEEVSEICLSVEPAKPISRIEDAGVTAV